MKLLEKSILLIGALVIVVTGVVLNNYLISKNSNDYQLYQTNEAHSTTGIILNTKTGDTWYVYAQEGEYFQKKYQKQIKFLETLSNSYQPKPNPLK